MSAREDKERTERARRKSDKRDRDPEAEYRAWVDLILGRTRPATDQKNEEFTMPNTDDSITVNGERYLRATVVLNALSDLSSALDYNDVALEEIDTISRTLGLIAEADDDRRA